jgi:hypothetical protein
MNKDEQNMIKTKEDLVHLSTSVRRAFQTSVDSIHKIAASPQTSFASSSTISQDVGAACFGAGVRRIGPRHLSVPAARPQPLPYPERGRVQKAVQEAVCSF